MLKLHHRHLLAVLAVAATTPLVAMSTACDQGGGSLRGDWLEAADCKHIGDTKRFEPFELSLEFANITEKLDTALIRMSPSARLIDQADQLIIAVDRTDPVNEGLAANGAFTLKLKGDGSGDADLTLGLLGRCTHASQALAAEGTLTLYDYGWKQGERMRGEMAFDLVDRRTGAIVGANFVGDFDFESLTSSSLTAFSPRDY